MTKQFVFLMLLVFTTSHAQQIKTPEAILDGIEAQIDGVAPGIAIGVVKDGEVILEWYKGYANLAHRVAIDSSSTFNIASMAKQFTAATLLQLAQEGKVDLQADIRSYFPELYPNIEKPMRIAQIINHTSGIRDYCDLMSVQGDPWWRREGLDNGDVMELLESQSSLNFEPGTDHIYSNSNYTLITALVAKISGMPFDEYADKLFERVGMNNTSFSTNYMDVIDNLASPYSNWGGPKWKRYPMMTDLHGDGFLYTTLPDQLRWEVMLQKNTDDPLVMTSQQPMTQSDYKAYGYGLEFDNYKGHRRVHHAGGTGSYGSEVMRFPDEGLSIVVMSNSGSLWASGTAAELADHYLQVTEGSQQFATGPETIFQRPALTAITGRYELEDGTIMGIVVKNDSLFREIEGREPALLMPVQGNVFRYQSNPDLQIAFVPNETSSYDFLLFHPQIAQRMGRRLTTVINADPGSLNGNYANGELDVTLKVSHLKDDTYNVAIWDSQYEVTLLEEDRLRFYGYNMEFRRGPSGAVEEMRLSYNRIQEVVFSKNP